MICIFGRGHNWIVRQQTSQRSNARQRFLLEFINAVLTTTLSMQKAWHPVVHAKWLATRIPPDEYGKCLSIATTTFSTIFLINSIILLKCDKLRNPCWSAAMPVAPPRVPKRSQCATDVTALLIDHPVSLCQVAISDVLFRESFYWALIYCQRHAPRRKIALTIRARGSKERESVQVGAFGLVS